MTIQGQTEDSPTARQMLLKPQGLSFATGSFKSPTPVFICNFVFFLNSHSPLYELCASIKICVYPRGDNMRTSEGVMYMLGQKRAVGGK